jgi:hypothetical protein
MRSARAVSLLAALSTGASFAVMASCGDDGGGTGDAAADASTGDGGRPDSSTPSDTGATPDTGSPSDGSADTAPPDDGRNGVFLLQGHAGRTAISCDDGLSWVADQSLDDEIRCFSDGFDCDHHPGSAKGVTYGAGYFWATFGWGMPGGISRSADGVVWEVMLDGTTFGGIAYGEDRVMGTARAPQWSDDQGATWNVEDASILDLWNVRRGGFAAHDGGRFVMVGSDGDVISVVVSSDGGATWAIPTTLPAECGAGVQTRGGIEYGNGAIVIVGGDGIACRSTDGGATFTPHPITDGVESQTVWDGTHFRVWSAGARWESTDGATWTSTATTPNNLRIGPVAVSPETGTLVAVDGQWMQWYGEQDFWRSTDDGVTWTSLGRGTHGGHPARFLTYGRALPSTVCP